MSEPAPLVLIADDEKDIRDILRTKLEASGYRVVEAENGQDAIDKCRQELPALAVIDVRMPVMSGTEAVTHIKEDPSLKDVRIVFLSNFGEQQEINAWIDQKYAREMGALDYIKKSDDLDAIVKKIGELIHA